MSVSARARLPTKDEELGKRDDDFRPRRSSTVSSISSLFAWRKRRVAVAVAIVVILFYVFLPNLRKELGVINQRIQAAALEDPAVAVAYRAPAGAPPRTDEDDEGSKHYYNGVVRFYKLAQSLHKIGRTGGNMPQNRNVLFAAASLKSAANLVPMACEMARVDRNYVHMAIFGRSSLSLDEIMALNGVMNEEDCKVYFHDARGDYAEYSSDARAEAATRGAMKHIDDLMHPQSIIMDDSAKEELFFTRAMRQKAKDLKVSLIEIPAGKYEEWMWMTRLDATGLHDWFVPEVEILVHVPPGNSGSLIRLLKSLSNADYKGLKMPKLTIELPTDIEQPLKNYLWWFSWPPGKEDTQPSLLTTRHRVPSSKASSEQASIRFVESFYATHTSDQHVLALSPQVEVSPLYLQYLQYSILEYRHPNIGVGEADGILGFSLDIPTAGVAGTGDFKQPSISQLNFIPAKFINDESAAGDAPSPFLYQAVSSTATLILGDKWVKFHDFLSKRLQAAHSGNTGKTSKVVSETEPAWVEFLVELMRARGWMALHPASSFVTVHNELAQIPEEYARPPASDTKATEAFKQANIPEEEPFLVSAEPPKQTEHLEADPTHGLALHKMLPFSGELQGIYSLPHVTHEGDVVVPYEMNDKRDQYVTWFRAAIGGCQGTDASRPRLIHGSTADDLFCLPGVEMRFDDEQYQLPVDDEAARVAKAIADSTAEEMEKVAAIVPTSANALPIKQPAVVETLPDFTPAGTLDVS